MKIAEFLHALSEGQVQLHGFMLSTFDVDLVLTMKRAANRPKNRLDIAVREEVMLGRLAQSEQMRDFFITMWRQNPSWVKQGGGKCRDCCHRWSMVL